MLLGAQFRIGALAFVAALVTIPPNAHSQQPHVGRVGFVGTVTTADDPADRGIQIVFSNLNSPTPTVAFPSGYSDTFTKVYEDEDLIVLFFVAYLSGSTTTFYLNRKSLRFSRVDVGVLEALALRGDPRPTAQYGTLK